VANPLKGGIAKQVAKALKGAKMTLPATLIKVTPGTRTPGNISGGTNPTTASYAARGFVADYTAFELANTLIQASDRKISLLGATIASGAIPAADDMVTIDGATYRIMRVKRDPAAAVYELQARA
jgi:hypothetical protein